MQPLQADDPARVGPYRLLARLGAGGMGVVYLGRSPAGRAVAVKRVRESFARDPYFRVRFRREVAAARKVTGTFTAPLLDADPEAEVPWLVTDHLPGLSLREAVGTFGGLEPAAVRLLAAALAEALAGIHRAGLTHRDLKPENVMLTPGGPRVIDFGIARPEDATAFTVPGTVLGTPGYMSPEQASGGRPGPAGDVFALGLVLVHAATGRDPFGDGERAETLHLVRQARVPLDDVPDDGLRAVLADCLRREPGQRPSAEALLDRLGEPAASVRGTGWLPAALADEIDRRAAPPGAGWAAVPPPPRTPPALTAPASPVPGAGPDSLAGRTTAGPAVPGAGEGAGPAGDPGAMTADGPFGAVTADAPQGPFGARAGDGAAGPLGAVTADVPPGWPDPHAAVTADAPPAQGGAAAKDVPPGPLGAVTADVAPRPYAARTADGPTAPPRPGGGTAPRPYLTRRRMLVAAAAVPLAAGAALALTQALRSPSKKPSAAPPPSSAPSGAGPSTTKPRPTAPPTAVLRWRTKASDDKNAYPTLYGTSGVVVTANSTHTLHARGIDARTGKILWSHPIDIAPETRIAVGSDAAYLVEMPKDGMSLVHAVTPVSGAVRWTYHVPDLDFVWQLAATGRTALVLADSAVTALDSRTGHRRWRAAPDHLDIQFMAAGPGLVVVPADGALTALDLGSGRTRWRSRKAADPPQFALVGEGVVVTGDNYGVLHALRAGDGKTAWKKTVDYRTSVSRTGSGMLFLDDQDGHVRALRAATGEEAWAYPKGPGRTAPYGGSTVLGHTDGTVWAGTSTSNGPVVTALDAAEGHVLWTYGADVAGDGSDAYDAGSVALGSDGLVLLGTYGGYIEAVSPPVRPNGAANVAV